MFEQNSSSALRSPGGVSVRGLFSVALLSTLLAAPLSNANPNSSGTTTDPAQGTSEIEEITVLGRSTDNDLQQVPDILSDPLRERIIREIQELNELENEFKWRSESLQLELTSPRVRIGYDPRSALREPKQTVNATLPLDLMQPATIFSVDF